MVRINITALHVTSNRRATPCGLNNADRHVRMRGTKLHDKLLRQITEMLRIIGGRLKLGASLLIHVA